MEIQPLLLGSLMPHPPLLIPEIGGAELDLIHETQAAMRTLCQEIVLLQLDVLVIISPHGPMFEDAVTVMGGETLAGHFEQFGVGIHFSFANDTELVERILILAGEQRKPIFKVDEAMKAEFDIEMELDYGASVPLYYLHEAGYDGAILHISPGMMPVEAIYSAGALIQTALEQLGRKAVVIASGDNSHTLTPDAPAGYTEEGGRFDSFLQQAISGQQWRELLTQDPDFLEQAAEDTIPSCALLLGIFDEIQLQGQVLSYEGPFGVGYTVARFTPGTETPSLLTELQTDRLEKVAQTRANESPLVHLARTALETYVHEEKQIAPPAAMPPDWQRPAGCYVTVRMHGQLRGCIGTTEPATENLAQEVIQNAIAAGNEDDRFFPVEADELDHLTYTVYVLEQAEPVTDPTELDPKRYGLIVKKGDHYALLLPDLAGIRTVDEQLHEAMEKAGLSPDDEDAQLFRFQATKYT